tara:strand:- start:923 stop:1951 length:1029 start_codon:yes stop_codon:yes gene_type:complete
MLIFVGLGLDVNTITTEAYEMIKTAENIYFERYTSPPIPYNEYKFDFKYTEVGRDFIENGEKILNEAKNKTVALLSYGNSMFATTHMDLKMRAEKLGIKTIILHNSSILTALPGETGLHSYKFGRVTTLMTKTKIAPLSVYDIILKNLLAELHTLILLEYNIDEGIYIKPNESLNQLLSLELEQKKQVFTKSSFIIIASRIGMKKQEIQAGLVKDLIKNEYDKPPYCIIIPSKLHFTEIESLELIFKINKNNISDNSHNVKSTSLDMLNRYIPKTKSTLNKIKQITKNEQKYDELFKNINAYIEDAERFKNEERFELSILSIGYAEGLIDALVFLGEIEIKW